jgi:hypothetical protein
VSKKSKKKLAKAEALIAEGNRLKSEVLRKEVVRTGSWNNIVTTEASPAPPPVAAATAAAATPLQRRKRLMYAGIAGAIVLAAVVFYALLHFGDDDDGKKGKGKQKEEKISPKEASAKANSAAELTVLDTWHLPSELKEISGNVFVDEDRIACVQDNDGIIFTYNLNSKKIENRLHFGPKGDYEALALVEGTYYVLRVNGMLYEVSPNGKGKPRVKQYQLPLTLENDPEPMFYDQPNNRLLIGVKEIDPTGGPGKGLYSFDLQTKKMALEPAIMLTSAADNAAMAEEPTDEQDGKTKKKNKTSISPSEVVINHKTGEIYVLNGPQSEFIIADATGKTKTIIQLDKSIFPQPEGMCFSPSGELYISSEGAKGKRGGIIAKVELP